MRYNYYESMKEDFENYISDYRNVFENSMNNSELEDKLNDELFCSDAFTGNASGSYTFNSYKAAKYVTDNQDLCRESLQEFAVDYDSIADHFLNGDYEYFDVTIRCYILGSVISDFVGDLSFSVNSTNFDSLEDARGAIDDMESENPISCNVIYNNNILFSFNLN